MDKQNNLLYNLDVRCEMNHLSLVKVTGISWIVKGEVKVTGEFSGSYTWGKNIEESIRHDATYEADVPPKTKVTVTAVVTRGSFEVPFSYMQADLLTTGDEEIQKLNDGIYGSINCYNLRYETTEEKIL